MDLSNPQSFQSYGHCGLSSNIHYPNLSRVMERLVIHQFLYPAFLSSSPESLIFSDQFAFRPTGSTTSALVWFLHTITQMLTQHDYVIVLALDFSKAFDTVQHSTLLDKLDAYTSLIMYITGSLISSLVTHTAPHLKAKCRPSLTYQRVSQLCHRPSIVCCSRLRPCIKKTGNMLYKCGRHLSNHTRFQSPLLHC